MKHLLFSNPLKKGIQTLLALAIGLFSLGPAGSRVVYAAPPVNDDFNSAKVITTLTYGDTLVTTEATPTVANPTTDDPNNFNCDGDTLAAGYSSVWYRYTPGAAESIALNTAGSNYDTFIAVWTGNRGNLNLVACNDDTFAQFTSDLFFIGTPGTTYHIEVAKFNGIPEESCDIHPGGCNLQFNAFISTTNVSIHGTVVGNYSIPTGGSLRTAYAGIDNGPAKITNTNAMDGIAALRVIWREPGFRASYSEMMGLPKEQLSNEYWFPWYNNIDTASMDQGFRIANVDNSTHTIRVFLGASQIGTDIILASQASIRVGYAVNNGPIRITCTTCSASDKIIAALRVIWKEPGVRFSYSEMMGLPKEQLSSEYWYPWYNNAVVNSMDQNLRIANVDTTAGNTVEVRVGTTLLETVSLAAGASIRRGYSVDNGPVRITCTTCNSTSSDKILTALRVIWKEPGYRSSYSEMMGLPVEQLSTEYRFPWYNNLAIASMDQGFRIANVDTTSHTIKIMVGAADLATFALNGGASVRVGYAVDNGPIRVICTTCNPLNVDDKIITAIRVIWQEPGFRSSYSEMMGLPVEALSTEYWFPWYNNAFPNTIMDQGFRFGIP